MCTDLHIIFPATRVILSTSISHNYQFQQHQHMLYKYAITVAQLWMEYKSLFTCALLTSEKFGVKVVIFTLSQK